jgi:uncharacterized protein DUF4345
MRPGWIWFSRVVLGLAGLLLVRIGGGLLLDPVQAVTEQGIALPFPSAITSMRALGGGFAGVGLLLVVSLPVARWIRSGLVLLLTFAGALTAGRLVGLVVDGPAAFTLKVIKLEIVLVALSILALLTTFRRPQGGTGPSRGERVGPRAALEQEDPLR